MRPAFVDIVSFERHVEVPTTACCAVILKGCVTQQVVRLGFAKKGRLSITMAQDNSVLLIDGEEGRAASIINMAQSDAEFFRISNHLKASASSDVSSLAPMPGMPGKLRTRVLPKLALISTFFCGWCCARNSLPHHMWTLLPTGESSNYCAGKSCDLLSSFVYDLR